MSKPKLDEIIKMMQKGEEFELDNEQYRKKTGLNIPKSGKKYVEKLSSVAKVAQKHGFLIEYTPAKIKFRKK